MYIVNPTGPVSSVDMGPVYLTSLLVSLMSHTM